jgi:DNA-binding PadR family transcriptional regulator
VIGRYVYGAVSLLISLTISDTDIMIDMKEVHGMDEENESAGSRYERGRKHWMRHWMRHTAVVPKGFLRYKLLKMLSDKPMSGSEIMSEIEKQTNGYWKPSPGSIYPLLSWLQDQGHIKEATQQEPGIRRYELTEQGKKFLEDEGRTREELDRRLEHFGPTPGLIGPMWFGFDRENAKELRKAARDFGHEMRDFFHELKHQYSKDAAEQAKDALEEAAKKIQDITNKLQEQRKE